MSDFFQNTIHLSNEDISEHETEFIPLITTEEEEAMNSEKLPETLPLLPLRNNVLFPGVVIPITVGRDKSIKLIQDANKGDKLIGVVGQKDMAEENPTLEDLHRIGTVAKIVKLLKMPDGSTTVIIQGKKRFVLESLAQEDPYFIANISSFNTEKVKMGKVERKALESSLKDLALSIVKNSPNIPSEAGFAIKNIESFSFLVNFVASNMNAAIEAKQEILEQVSAEGAAELVMKSLTKELHFLEIKQDIQSKVKSDIDQQQREYFLHQQIKTIQEELGDNPTDIEIAELKEKAKGKKWGDKVKKTFEKEIEKIYRLNPSSPEYSIQLNYLELLAELPWNEYNEDNLNLKKAQTILDKDHFGLDDVKERIIEQLAVFKLKKDVKAPILCFNGPPGVGKTSLGKSIAKALGREYVRVSLGGLRDEAELRGHRKTYIGAMPGRIIQNLKKCGSANPVFVLDELDKISSDAHGDPESALLEVLDPEQNSTFHDNYVDQDFDLSRVMFIATTNNIERVHPALIDRMEVINVNGYTLEEKVEIARKYLLPRKLEETGLDKSKLKLNKKVLSTLISEYTFESGVRRLEKRIAKLCRNRAKQIAFEEEYEVEVVDKDLLSILGPSHVPDVYEGNETAGVAIGLGYNPAGGSILYVESSISEGKGMLSTSGNLGAVIKESCQIAWTYLKSNADNFGIDYKLFDNYNVHIHLPEGGVKKDGPSAGITMLTALASVFTQRKVKRNLAMTGEITLRGKVLPVGGIKEKILAAKRVKIKEIILCKANEKDVLDIKENYVKGLTFHYVETMEDVLKIALLKEKVSKPRNLVISK
jgi:ATP-dependent Lon protease